MHLEVDETNSTEDTHNTEFPAEGKGNSDLSRTKDRMGGTADMGPSNSNNLAAFVIISLIIGFIVGFVVGFQASESIYSDIIDGYKSIANQHTILLVYSLYKIALTDLGAAVSLIKAHYYSNYLDDYYKSFWAQDVPPPELFVDDAMYQLDKALSMLNDLEVSEEYSDEVETLRTYIEELRRLVLDMQQIANKNVYTREDVLTAIAIYKSFYEYNDKIYEIIKNMAIEGLIDIAS